MELSFETDAEALWQDALELLQEKGLPDPTISMLTSCKPTELSNQTLTITTSMRLITKTVAHMIPEIEACLSTAAFQPITLAVVFTGHTHISSQTNTRTNNTPISNESLPPQNTPLEQKQYAVAPIDISSTTTEEVADNTQNKVADMTNTAATPKSSAEIIKTAPDSISSANTTPTTSSITSPSFIGQNTMSSEEILQWQQETAYQSDYHQQDILQNNSVVSSLPFPYTQGITQLRRDTPQNQLEKMSPLAQPHQQSFLQGMPTSTGAANPLIEQVSVTNSKLTFDRFVCGEENDFAYQAALQVANGMNKSYNPLFIYGKSGLGKTHLLRAIQNYVFVSDPSRSCIYRDASAFITDYTSAMNNQTQSAAQALRQNYSEVDILIIDDIQNLIGKAGTIKFFFDVFNTLVATDKQIVLAADRTPADLGLGKDGFDERIVSRIGSGFSISIQVPNYELKLKLIDTFCTRMKQDFQMTHTTTSPLIQTVVSGSDLSDDAKSFMAELAGSNIRLIEGFCQRCLFAQAQANKTGNALTHEQLASIAKETWPENKRSISVEDIQRAVESRFDISHADLVGGKRNKEIMTARHVSIFLARELCDKTLAYIGEKHGGRSHATVKNSISYIESTKKTDRPFYDVVIQLRDSIING